MIVCSDHIVVDRLCVRRKLDVLVVVGFCEGTLVCIWTFLPSFRYIT